LQALPLRPGPPNPWDNSRDGGWRGRSQVVPPRDRGAAGRLGLFLGIDYCGVGSAIGGGTARLPDSDAVGTLRPWRSAARKHRLDRVVPGPEESNEASDRNEQQEIGRASCRERV